MARSSSSDNPTPPEICWIWYQLKLRNIELEDIAKKTRRTTATVSRVISRKRKSETVEPVIAEMLGFASFEDLMEAAIQRSKEDAA